MMTVEEIDRAYPIECAERQQAMRAREHSFALYDYHGKQIAHPNIKENLLKIISERDIYIVDSNSLWKKECLAPENSKKAFIICPALAHENPNTKDLILNATRSKLGNIFSFGIDASLNCILIDLIDEPFKDVFDIVKLRQASKQKPVTPQAVWNGIEIEKQKIRDIIRPMLERMISVVPYGSTFLKSGLAADLPPQSETQVMADAFKIIIRQMRLADDSLYQVAKSQKLALLCYATLLFDDKQERKDEGTRFEFDCPQYENVFGDMHIVQAAIYFKASILTIDKKLEQMASYADLKCHHVPQSKNNKIRPL